MFQKEYKNLYKMYKKKLAKIYKNKKLLPTFSDSLEYFITYIKFLRDYAILTEPFETLDKNIRVVSLCSAIYEYENYLNCFNNYYKKTGKAIERRDVMANPDDVAKLFAQEKLLHLSRFWGIVNTNMENWKNLYDCTI